MEVVKEYERSENAFEIGNNKFFFFSEASSFDEGIKEEKSAMQII